MSSKTPRPSSSSAVKRSAPSEPPRGRAKRRKGINGMSDAEAAEKHSDAEVLNAAREAWRSPAYGHYIPTLERHKDEMGHFSKFVIRFDCKHKHPGHNSQHRDRLSNGDGTGNLITSAAVCDRERGVVVPARASAYPALSYSAARHRAILALRCARDRRPFESVVDELHRQEVELLRPGTSLPTAETVSTDVRRIYIDAAEDVSRYLKQNPGALHLALDGWTSPTHESYLGVVVFWYAEGKLWRSILEFIRLTEAHAGEYLAQRVQNCLARFGIEDKILSICADNAGNNDTLCVHLHKLVSTFGGPNARTHCFAHILNLMAKAFLSLFSTPPHRSKGTESNSAQNQTVPAANDLDQEPEDSTDDVSSDKLEHDDGVVKGVGAQALAVMADWGTQLSDEEQSCARRIMQKVAGLARRVNDSPTLMEEFERLVDSDPDLKGDAKVLARRIATRWNTDHTALKSHLHFKTQVQILTHNKALKLQQYALSSEQWDIADELCQVLAIFDEPTKLFSQKEVPMIHEVLPIMLTLRARLYDARDDPLKHGLHPITRIAAQAALFVWDKYMGAILEGSDIYLIAVVMCPDRKLKWFSERPEFDVNQIYRRIVDHFTARSPSQPESAINRQPLHGGNIWTQQHTSSAAPPPNRERDSMAEYLSTSVEHPAVIAQSGGVLGYWSSRLDQCPRLARFALDFLTAPASSVDAERAFSGGRLIINHLQHQMSTRSFQAQMAVGSWYGTPLLPSLDDVAQKLAKHM